MSNFVPNERLILYALFLISAQNYEKKFVRIYFNPETLYFCIVYAFQFFHFRMCCANIILRVFNDQMDHVQMSC